MKTLMNLQGVGGIDELEVKWVQYFEKDFRKMC